MLTVAEAIRRLDINNMAMRRKGSLNWEVYFREDKQQNEHNTYVTDDLDDAVIEASRMRKARGFKEINVTLVSYKNKSPVAMAC